MPICARGGTGGCGLDAGASAKDMALVSNKSNGVTEVSMTELVKICKGQTHRWPKGRPVTFFSLNPASSEMKLVLEKVYGMSSDEVSALISSCQPRPSESSRHRGGEFRQSRWWRRWNPLPARSAWWTCIRSPEALPYCGSKANSRLRRDIRCTETSSRSLAAGRKKPRHEPQPDPKSDSRTSRRFPRHPLDVRVSVHVFRSGENISFWGRSSELGEDGIGATLTGELEPGEVVSMDLVAAHGAVSHQIPRPGAISRRFAPWL